MTSDELIKKSTTCTNIRLFIESMDGGRGVTTQRTLGVINCYLNTEDVLKYLPGEVFVKIRSELRAALVREHNILAKEIGWRYH